MERLKYPIGKFSEPKIINDQLLFQWISEIESFPKRLIAEVKDLSENQLNTPYREGGWTVRKLVHHCADSHMNAFIRLKLALTENNPVIRPYFEDRWAEISEASHLEIEPSLKIIEGVHQRWVFVLKNLSEEEWNKTFQHPELHRTFTLKQAAGMYAWHGLHHLTHITNLKKINNW